EVAGEADRLVKRLVPTSKGDLPAGMVRLADVPALSLLMIASDGEDEADEPAEDAAEAEEIPTIAAGSVSTVETADGVEDEIADNTGEASNVEQSETGDTADHDEPGQVQETTAGDGDARGTSDDKWYFNTNGDATAATDAAAEDTGDAPPADAVTEASAPDEIDTDAVDAEVAGAASPDIAAAPLRFVWRTDADGKFSALSDEFRQAFGAEATNIVGRDFAEVADEFALDPDGEIAGLMKRRDTWSGRSVLWPITGTDLVAPVDLAALPVYGRDGTFEGFRGFGIARMGDAVVDDQARGLALIGELTEPADDGEMIVAPADFAGEDHDPFKGETPALAMDETPERRESDKVIRLAERRSQQAPKGLSSAEQETFQEIGKRLKDASTEDDVEEADSTGQGEATEDDAATGVESSASTATEPLGLVASEIVETDSETQQPSDDAEEAMAGSDEVLPDETPKSADEDAKQVEAVTSDEAGAAVDETAADAVEATGDTDTVAETSDDSAHDETAAVDVVGSDDNKAVAGAEETQTRETDASAIASSDAEVAAPAEVAAGEDAENEGPNGEAIADEEAVAASADEAETADEASQVEDTDADTVDDGVEPAEIAATGETAPEPATSEPAKSEPESTKKPKVGLSAFLPSAFSGGGTIDASIGIDS
ncbi:MAG: hypothetical protein KDJ43_04180, partial [Rhizobiaceae bacterium]|nr:hypothetical protein [Rhizobiaceae bacterium]